MYDIKVRNCGLLSYGTVQSKWSAQTIWPGPTASIICWPVYKETNCSSQTFVTMYVPDYTVS